MYFLKKIILLKIKMEGVIAKYAIGGILTGNPIAIAVGALVGAGLITYSITQ